MALSSDSFPNAEHNLHVGMILIVAASFLAILGMALHRLYLHPLSNVPGPKLAAITQWYQTYYDVWLHGQLTLHIEELHKQYGPIVRIGPSEVHINDPEFYGNIYSSTNHFSKYAPHQIWADAPTSSMTTIPHSLHRIRRGALNPFFSKQAIARYVPEIQDRVSVLCDRLNTEYKGTNTPVRIDWLGGAFSSDVVMQYCFGRSYDFVLWKDFDSTLHHALRDLAATVHLCIDFPWILKIMKAFPENRVGAWSPKMAAIFEFRQQVIQQAKATIESPPDPCKTSASATVFREILNSDLPPEEKTLKRLSDEAQIVVAAGTDSIKGCISVTVCHVLLNPALLATLKAELLQAWPDVHSPPSLQVLEKLPFLAAVIQESIRLTYGAPMRLARTSTKRFFYKEHVLLPGTVFSMSIYSMHHNETVFPDSHTYDPTRWLNSPMDPTGKKQLSQYMVAFSKGTRICPGFNLAWAQLTIAIANLFRRVEMELFETTSDDVKMAKECFVPFARAESQGVRVLVK